MKTQRLFIKKIALENKNIQTIEIDEGLLNKELIKEFGCGFKLPLNTSISEDTLYVWGELCLQQKSDSSIADFMIR